MDARNLLAALRRTAIDNHRCFGCGYEHNCSIRGCAINREAAELIKALQAELVDERHRHDRYVDFELAQAKELEKVRNRLAHYENMEEQGRLFIKPFKEGETAYYADEDTGRVLMGYVASYEILSDGAVYVEFTNVESYIPWVSVQLTLAEAEKTVFLTREEAEQALRCEHEEST